MHLHNRSHRLILTLLLVLTCVSANATLISRDIIIDGDISDWQGDGSSANPDITTNPGQFSEDAEGTVDTADLDYLISSTGRDLEYFAFTWTDDDLFLLVGRYASISNQTDWFFYLDTNNDGRLDNTEYVIHVDWKGSNRTTTVERCNYIPANPDPSVGDFLSLNNTGQMDGYDMPGTIPNQCTSLYQAKGGENSGLRMEVRVSWADLGMTEPGNLQFHISSAIGTNIPNQIQDNMSGPAGTSLFPPDLSIIKTASTATAASGQSVTYTIVLTNELYTDMTGIQVQDFLPSQMQWDGTTFTVTAGTFADTNTDGLPDTWTVPSLVAQASETLTITASAVNDGPVSVNSVNTASLIASTPADEINVNDTDTAIVQITPGPRLTATKVISSTTPVSPSGTVRYTVTVTNIASINAESVIVRETVPAFTELGMQTFAGAPFNLISNSSGLSLGTPEYSSDGINFSPTPPNPGFAFDPDITHWQLPLSGSMNNTGANFQIEYELRVK